MFSNNKQVGWRVRSKGDGIERGGQVPGKDVGLHWKCDRQSMEAWNQGRDVIKSLFFSF